jgi:hydroxymethylpyrimidine/phosphomethylpyrimidine kinase
MTVAGPEPRVVLVVAGLDPSGGAGVLADARTLAHHGVHACGVVAAITAQSTREVRRVGAVAPAMVRQQLEALLADVAVHAVKVGLLASAANARVVAEVVRALGVPVVVDPVLRATTGRRLLGRAALDALREHLLPVATVVTPNAAEAAALTEGETPRDEAGMRAAARALVGMGARAALVTGGHVAQPAGWCVDVLGTLDGEETFRVPRIAAAPVRGTGCMLSTAIAAHLARGASLGDAVQRAKDLLTKKLRATLAPGRGARTLV